MLKGNDLMGMPIVTFDTGKQIEKVYDIIFDQNSNAIVGLLVDEGGWFSSARILPLTNIKTIGEDAILVENAQAIIPAKENPVIQAILDKNNALKGTKVMTEDGKDLGTMKDLQFDERTGQVLGYEVSGGMFADAYNGRSVLPAPSTLKVGEDVAFVPIETAHLLQEQNGGIKAAVQSAGENLKSMKDSATQKTQEVTGQASQKAQELKQKATSPEASGRVQYTADQLKQEASEFWKVVKDKANTLKDQSDKKMEEMKINNALGRPVNRVIFDKQDEVILNVGDIITNQAIERSRQAGVLNILLSSVYTQQPELSKDEMRAKEATRPLARP